MQSDINVFDLIQNTERNCVSLVCVHAQTDFSIDAIPISLLTHGRSHQYYGWYGFNRTTFLGAAIFLLIEGFVRNQQTVHVWEQFEGKVLLTVCLNSSNNLTNRYPSAMHAIIPPHN